jgi:23S rRNA (cytidine1920-2'-O)/16S rRNA (cytidine1409-2'-O)-methyltransferase
LAKKSKKTKIRSDEAMLAAGLASNIEEARALIMAGQLLEVDQRVAKPSDMVEPDLLRLKKDSVRQYVSRGGEKIESAVQALGIASIFEGARVADLGASTGGFTDFALKSGARQVIAVDVGHNQLAWELRKHPDVISFESTHLRDLRIAARSRGLEDALDAVNVVIADLSFTSIARLLPDILAATPNATSFVMLVKPQFELDAVLVPQGGVVTNPDHRQLAVNLVDDAFRKLGFGKGEWVDSAVPGRTGNIEIFYHNIRKIQPATSARAEDKQ